MDYWLKKNDVKIPKLGFGTWQLTGDRCKKAVQIALDVGYRHIDTAQFYENEEFIGQALSESSVPREEVFLVTKVWRNSLELKEVLIHTSNSLEKLKTDYIDLLLIHWPNDQIPISESLSAMKELRETGKVKHIGVSNFTAPLLKKALAVDPNIVCNQVEYHPFLDQTKLLEKMKKQKVALVAYSPLARGQVLKDPTLIKIGKKYKKTPGQIVLRWLIEQENVITIPKSKNESRIKSNFNIFDFKLDEEDKVKIQSLGKKNKRIINPEFAPDWSS